MEGWNQMSKIIRKYSKKSFIAEIIIEYLAFFEKHLSNKIEDSCENYLDRIKDNFILSCGHVCFTDGPTDGRTNPLIEMRGRI